MCLKKHECTAQATIFQIYTRSTLFNKYSPIQHQHISLMLQLNRWFINFTDRANNNKKRICIIRLSGSPQKDGTMTSFLNRF